MNDKTQRPQRRKFKCITNQAGDTAGHISAKARHTPAGSSAPVVSAKQCLKEFVHFHFNPDQQDFYGGFRSLCQHVSHLPRELHWQLFMELADIAKRHNLVKEARAFFVLSNKLEPATPQSWLEQSKLEEECGRTTLACKLLGAGLQHCPLNEQLGIKYIKTLDKLGDLKSVRHYYRSLNQETHWKVVLEGVYVEARSGYLTVARQVLKELMAQNPHVSTLYLEAVKFEERWGYDFATALSICKAGLTKNSKYSPLWFAHLRLVEKAPDELATLLGQALPQIPKELLWKFTLEAALASDRNSDTKTARSLLKDAATRAPEALRWKVWVAGAQVELKARNERAVSKLLQQALSEVNGKQRPAVLVELSKFAEFTGDLEKAREYMKEAATHCNFDWKVLLNYISLELRAGNLDTALDLAKHSLSLFPTTGRLWASLIQLYSIRKSSVAPQHAFKTFLLALQEVPKSGEVWCEGARIRLNPFTEFYDLAKAESYLKIAIQLTPQYGDSFIELMRMYLLADKFDQLKSLKRQCINSDPNYGMLWLYCKLSPRDSPETVWKLAKRLLREELACLKQVYSSPAAKVSFVDSLWTGLAQVSKLVLGDQFDRHSRWRLIYGSDALFI